MTATCFWSILTMSDLEFVYIPSTVSSIRISGQAIGDLLLHHSLFEFMHPNEIALAKSDLSSFFQLKTLAGSVTRCRLLSLQNIANLHANNQKTEVYFKSNNFNANSQDKGTWSIVDLVIYTATNDTVLVCFHNADFETYLDCGSITSLNTSCQSRYRLVEEDVSNLTRLMVDKEVTKSGLNSLPIRIFQIVDQSTGLALFTWPPNRISSSAFQKENIVEVVQTKSKEMLLKEFKSSAFDQQQNEILCTRHFYASSKQEFLDQLCLFQRILIPYGNIIFESFQVSLIENMVEPKSTSMTIRQEYPKPTSPLPPIPQQQQHKYQEEIAKDEGKFYSSIHNIIKRPPNVSVATTELAVGEVEHQTLPGNLLSAVTPRSHEDELFQDQSPSSLFQKFRLNQHVVQQESPAAERRRKLIHSSHPFYIPGINDTNDNSSNNNTLKICARCRTSNSPEWRRGPDGHKTLCNACGLRYSRYRSKQWRIATNNKQ